ncbi:DNA mismatch repair protein MutL [Capsulimonas corticalis]|uniref:DNA mismatch repair protein MutL n=1 Tax=Capsulimonas corticalis TaxID=2219043 RepID=A0A402CRX6_9BACT|nr:DNA mismatch repair endonuclease MutL [Capsulimonas corticalis]BDI28164.1 DNA mismatch repair protein MutL [Capsulimonas corticalis]
MSSTPKIQILDDTTANQIAAGEVVERPAAAVKELVENALDAGAKRVLVELEEGGKYLIRVTDDGSGMSQEDAVLSLQRHATSKIRLADDLFKITTMGFRGEALPSIASVSQMTIVTRLDDPEEPDAPGIELRCNGGTFEGVTEVGARTGTSITVENLFYNVPARLKFLKTSQTETNHIVELMQRFALAYPHVAFRLQQNNQELFSSGGSGSMMDACVQVFGRDTARHLVPMDYEAGGLRVWGFVASPAALKNARSWQHSFVNRRFVRNKAVTRALDEGYKSVQTIHGVKYPPAVIMIDVDPGQVDINVSPTKTEVRFTREGEIYSAVYHAVKEALLAGGLVPTLIQKMTPGGGEEASPASGEGARKSSGVGYGQAPLFQVPSRPPVNVRRQDVTQSPFHEALLGKAAGEPDPFEDAAGYGAPANGYAGTGSNGAQYAVHAAPPSDRVQEGALMLDSPEMLEQTEFAREGGDAPLESTAPIESATGGDYRNHNLGSLRVLAQSRNMYIVAQTDHALVLIDQHIAHERVLYEKLIAGAEGAGAGVPVQQLMIPFTLELSKREAMVVENRLEDLRRAGFELEPFGGESYLVRSVPASVAQKHIKAQGGPEEVLREIVDELVEKTTSRRLMLPAEEVLITASCKMAVKAGDPLTFEEMNALVSDLLKSDNPYTCPHGRPIIVELANSDLDRKFGR